MLVIVGGGLWVVVWCWFGGFEGLFILYVGVVIDSCDLIFSWFVVIVWFVCYGLRCLIGVWVVVLVVSLYDWFCCLLGWSIVV